MDDSSNGRAVALYRRTRVQIPAQAPYEITLYVQPVLMVASCPINNLKCIKTKYYGSFLYKLILLPGMQ